MRRPGRYRGNLLFMRATRGVAGNKRSGKKLVARKYSAHEPASLFDADQHGAINVVNDESPEGKHDQEMDLAQIVDTNERRKPANEKAQHFAAEYMIVEG